ncbi:unnamed protein product, partial [Litomosoides sigmodontis]
DGSTDVTEMLPPTFGILDTAKVGWSKTTDVRVFDSAPPPVKLSRVSEISFQPLQLAVNVQNQMQNVSRNYKTFKRARHKGTVEFVAEENIIPESYKLESTPYEGPLETISMTKGLQFAPIHEYSDVYHYGNSYVKSRKRRNASEKQNIFKAKKTALHLHGSNSDIKDGEEKNVSEIFLPKSKEMMYSASTVYKTPVGRRTNAKKQPSKYCRVSGDVEIVDKSFVKPETYNIVAVPYDGPVSCLECGKELSFTPLQECIALYNSGISHKKTRLRDSSTESSASFSSSSSCSSSSISRASAYASEKREELKQKAILYVTPDNENDADVVITKSPKRKGIFTFWRRAAATPSEKEGSFSHDEKEKLKTSSKHHLVQSQTVLEEPRKNLDIKSEDEKMTARLSIKKEPSTTSGYDDGNSRRGKFDKKESLNRSSSSLSGQNRANVETKKNAVSSLKCDTEFSDGVPLNLKSSRGFFRQESAVSSMSAILSHKSSKSNKGGRLSKTDESKLVDKNNTISLEKDGVSTQSNIKKCDRRNGIRYPAKVKVKCKMRNTDNSLQRNSSMKATERSVSDNAVSRKSSFVIKEFCLRRPPCNSEAKGAIHSSSKYEPEKVAHITEAVETDGETIVERQGADFPDCADKSIACEKLEMKRLSGSGIALKENNKECRKFILVMAWKEVERSG